MQITTELSEVPDEKLISVYFIFRDKPSSYFWEIKPRENNVVFEFHDTNTGTSPVPSVSESPIKGFTIEEGKIDINKDVRGLKPEWRDRIKVIFNMEAIPEIHVNDEFSIVSFSLSGLPILQRSRSISLKITLKNHSVIFSRCRSSRFRSTYFLSGNQA